MVNYIKDQLRFGFEGDISWNTGNFATIAVICPLFRQIQSAVDDRCRGAMDQRGIHAGLAIIDLAEAAATLASNSDRLLGNSPTCQKVGHASAVRLGALLSDKFSLGYKLL